MVQKTRAGDLGNQLVTLRRDSEERQAKRRAEALKIPYVDLRQTPVTIEALKLIPEADAKNAGVAAVEIKVHELALAVANPTSEKTAAVVKNVEAQGYTVKLFVTSHSGLTQAWYYYKFITQEAKDITGEVKISEKTIVELMQKFLTTDDVKSALTTFDFTELKTTYLLEVVLAGALALKASDVHFEAEEEHAKLRFRLDGVLHDVFAAFPIKHYHAIVSRIKLLSGLKINVMSEAQDGRFTILIGKKTVEMRVSIIPVEYGETVVMRILDPDVAALSLEILGMRPDDLALVEREIARPNGLILNTGPTGSGKTTTLYAFLTKIANSEIKVITIEDPIEYHLTGIEQTQVDAKAKYTFADGLRAIVRQDPDVILVGEIRDKETADIALQAALTGHLVLSTLHTNNAVGAVPRLVNLGAKTESIGPALSLIIAQRLVRKLCDHCRKIKEVPADLAENVKKFLITLPSRVDRKLYEKITLYEPAGCDACNNFGYRGRVAVFEFLATTPEFEELILKEASEVALIRYARSQEMVSMQEDGILKAITGVTTFDEVVSVTGPIEWPGEKLKSEGKAKSVEK